MTNSRFITLSVLAFIALFGTHTHASSDDGSKCLPKLKNTWVVGFDNDILVPGSRDQDYTYGINLALIGDNADTHLLSSHRLLKGIDRFLGVEQVSNSSIENKSIEYGLFGFTPEDTSISEPNPNDRPYASLVYTSSSRERLNSSYDSAIQTTLTIGVLGLSVVGDLQQGLHEVLNNSEPQGWGNQISDGGELTAKYSIAKQDLLVQHSNRLEVKQDTQLSVGYITEASYSVGFRLGKIGSPWAAFKPEQATYGERATPLKHTSATSEHFFWGGLALKGRAYNAFLQGQFRNSEVTYNFDELNHLIVEGWLGYTHTLPKGYAFSYYVRGHTSEIRIGDGNRNVIWGGLLLSRNLDSII